MKKTYLLTLVLVAILLLLTGCSKECEHQPAEAVKENEIAATCEAAGSYDEVVYCTSCNAEISRTKKTTERLNHTPAPTVKENEIPATCKVDGSYDEVVYCSVCNTQISRAKKEIAKLDTHTPADAVKENETPATHTKDGSYDEVVYCSVCDTEISRVKKEIPRLEEHTPKEAVRENEQAATCKTAGSYDEVVYCSACGEEISRVKKEIPKLTSHTAKDPVTENEIPATTEAAGSYDEVIYCSVCDAEISRDKKEIPKLEPQPPSKIYYVITFSVDGNETAIEVEEGMMPVYTGSTEKAPTDRVSYTFIGWDSEIVPATQDFTYTAKYEKSLRNFTVSFVANGVEVATRQIPYNTKISLPSDITTPELEDGTVFMWTNIGIRCTKDTVCEAVYAWGDYDSLNWAYSYEIIKYSGIYDGEEDTDARANAFLYLVMSENRLHCEIVRDRALEHIRSLITSGQEPSFTAGPFWHYATASFALMMSRYTPSIWDELSEEEHAKIDLLMKCYAVATAFVADDENYYKTGVSLMGNHAKTWNPNHRLAMTLPIVASTVYFSYGGADGASYVNSIFLNFDYDAFIAKFDEYGFTRIKTSWSTEGYTYEDGTKSAGAKELLTNGGVAIYATKNDGGDLIGLTLGENLGSGRGVKGNTFTYFGIPLSNLAGIVEHMYSYTYSGGSVVSDSSSMEGGLDAYGKPLAYIIDGTKSPVEGETGMMYEMISGDGKGIRSTIAYCSHDLMLVVQSMAALEKLGFYQHNTESALFRKIWIGNTDVIYKYNHGYHGYSLGEGSDYYDNEITKYTPWKTLWLSEYADAFEIYRDISYKTEGAVSDELVYEYKYDDKNAQTIPLPSLGGTVSIFEGWYLDDKYSRTELDGLKIEDGVLYIPVGYSAKIELFAKFKLPDNFGRINYPAEAILPSDAPGAFEFGSTVTLPTATREGYIFVGWYRDAALTQSISEITENDTFDVILYAKWLRCYISEDFSAEITTPIKAGGNIGSLNVNGNNGSSSFTSTNGHLVWSSSSAYGFVFLDNTDIRDGSSDVFTMTLSVARPDGENVSSISFRLRDAQKNDTTPFSFSSSTNSVMVEGNAIMAVPEIKDGFVTLKVTVDFANSKIYYYDGDNTLIYTQTVEKLTSSLRKNLHDVAPGFVCNATGGNSLSILIDRIEIREGALEP